MKPLSSLNTIKVALALIYMALIVIAALQFEAKELMFFILAIPLILREITAEEMPEDYDQ